MVVLFNLIKLHQSLALAVSILFIIYSALSVAHTRKLRNGTVHELGVPILHECAEIIQHKEELEQVETSSDGCEEPS